MADYTHDDFTGDGIYLVTYGGKPKPQGPFPNISDMAFATHLADYPSNGYVVSVDNGAVSLIPSLNPDDLVTTSPTLAQRIAADIVRAAEQYPAVRQCRSFGELHDKYDANESIIAAAEASGEALWNEDGGVKDKDFTAHNIATDEVDAILGEGGFAALERFAQGIDATHQIVSMEVPAQFIAKVLVDTSDPDNPRVIRIDHFTVSPWESFAGYFGKGAEVLDDDVPEPVEEASIGYWKACNDGTWPLTDIRWKE